MFRSGFSYAGWVAQPINSVAISASVKMPPRRHCRAWLMPSAGILGSREKRLARQSIDRTFTQVIRKRRPRQVLLEHTLQFMFKGAALQPPPARGATSAGHAHGSPCPCYYGHPSSTHETAGERKG